MSIETSSVSLKLVIDAQSERVLFAEAGKDFVDFLFCVLSLPVAKLISLVGPQATVGSLTKLYGGLENLGESYIQSSRNKNDVLNSVVNPAGGISIPLLDIKDISPLRKMIYGCSNCSRSSSSYVAYDPTAICPRCFCPMNMVLPCVVPPSKVQGDEENGLVKEMVTYMVMDDLEVKPISTTSLFTSLLKTYDIENVSALEEKEVILGMNEAVKLLKASVETNQVLTCVFLKGGDGAAESKNKMENGDSDHTMTLVKNGLKYNKYNRTAGL